MNKEMTKEPRKVPEIVEEMSEMLLRAPKNVPSSEAADVAYYSAVVAWYESIGFEGSRKSFTKHWRTLEAKNPNLWSELKSNDINAMIDELICYKKQRYPDDRRQIVPDVEEKEMTETDWLASANPREIYRPNPNIKPDQMLQFLRANRSVDRTKQGRRKLRLYACACCRRFSSALSENSLEALRVAEQFADGEASKKDLGRAKRITIRQYGYGPRTADGIAGHVAEASAMTAAVLTAMVSYDVVASAHEHRNEAWREMFQQASIIRDIFGNPFRNTVLDALLRFASEGSIRGLAERIYENRDFGSLPELGEALSKAGCTDEVALEHCREPEHFKGCWVLDALRGLTY